MKNFSLERNMQCLCGSGQKYKNCCIDILSNISENMDIQEEINQKNFERALKYARADLTQYMQYVKGHTELLLLTNPTLGERILTIDLKALESIIEKILFIIKGGNLDVDFITTLNNLGNVFYNPKWHERLIYYKVVWFYIYQNNSKEAEVLLSEVSYKEIDDIEFLQLFLDLKKKELSFSNKIEIIDKIIQKTDKSPVKIQYMGAKGVEFLLIDDLERAKEIFIDAILIAEKNISEFKETYDYFQLANVYNHTGKMCGNEEYIEKAITYYIKVTENDIVTPMGISDVYARLGDAYVNLGNQLKALEYYHKSIEVHDNPVSKIFIAHIYIAREEFDKASDILNGIDIDRLEDEEKVDFVFIYAQLIMLTKKKDKAEYILTKLKDLEVSSKYFSDTKNSLIIDLQEVFYSPTSEVEESRVKKVLRKLNDYFQLQPNINGIGINLNNIFKDLLEKKSE